MSRGEVRAWSSRRLPSGRSNLTMPLSGPCAADEQILPVPFLASGASRTDDAVSRTTMPAGAMHPPAGRYTIRSRAPPSLSPANCQGITTYRPRCGTRITGTGRSGPGTFPVCGSIRRASAFALETASADSISCESPPQPPANKRMPSRPTALRHLLISFVDKSFCSRMRSTVPAIEGTADGRRVAGKSCPTTSNCGRSSVINSDRGSGGGDDPPKGASMTAQRVERVQVRSGVAGRWSRARRISGNTRQRIFHTVEGAMACPRPASSDKIARSAGFGPDLSLTWGTTAPVVGDQVTRDLRHVPARRLPR